LTGELNEAGFTIVRIGYDQAEVDERVADLRTRLAAATKRSADLERVLRRTVAEAAELLDRRNTQGDRAVGQQRQVDESPPSDEPVRPRRRGPSRTRDPGGAEVEATPVEPPAMNARAADPVVEQAMREPPLPVPSEPQLIWGTIRRLAKTDTDVVVWVVPEDQPQSLISISFTEADVGSEAVEYVCTNFAGGDAVRIWHTDRHGRDIELV
jgi:hypothetical protein